MEEGKRIQHKTFESMARTNKLMNQMEEMGCEANLVGTLPKKQCGDHAIYVMIAIVTCERYGMHAMMRLARYVI